MDCVFWLIHDHILASIKYIIIFHSISYVIYINSFLLILFLLTFNNISYIINIYCFLFCAIFCILLYRIISFYPTILKFSFCYFSIIEIFNPPCTWNISSNQELFSVWEILVFEFILSFFPLPGRTFVSKLISSNYKFFRREKAFLYKLRVFEDPNKWRSYWHKDIICPIF